MSKIYTLLKKISPSPKVLSMDSVALEISPGVIRIMKMKEVRSNLIPVFYKEIIYKHENELPGSSFSEDEQLSIVSILKKLRQEYKIKNVATVLPDKELYIYRTEVPREAIQDIDSAIKFGLEENVPFSAEEVNFNYNISEVNSASIEVTVNVFPIKIIQAYTDLIKKAGLIPLSFIPESTAVANALIKKNDKNPYLIVKIEEDYASTSIVSNGVVQYASRISVDGTDLKNLDDSKEAKKLSQELNKTLIFWFTTNAGLGEPQKIQDALLVGKYAQTDGMVDYLENSLKIDVELGNVWSNCFSLDEYIPEIHKEKSLEYACPIGLYVESLKFK